MNVCRLAEPLHHHRTHPEPWFPYPARFYLARRDVRVLHRRGAGETRGPAARNADHRAGVLLLHAPRVPHRARAGAPIREKKDEFCI